MDEKWTWHNLLFEIQLFSIQRTMSIAELFSWAYFKWKSAIICKQFSFKSHKQTVLFWIPVTNSA